MIVDEHDHALGTMPRTEAHRGNGTLHRAISVFLLNERGEVLVQQRHVSKRLWGGYWSNSCCTHPFQFEDSRDAATRRVREELGVNAALEYQYKFTYQANFTPDLAEHELCSVFLGSTSENPKVDNEEISDWKWCSPQMLDEEISSNSALYTPWMILEWTELRNRKLV